MKADTTRRLGAILFADIAGYTAMMQHDEQSALEKLALFKQILQEKTSEFYGDIVQYYGDGCLVIFDSPLSAVKCAESLQQAYRGEFSVPVRIGIHLGDLVFKQGNVLGDSINIASRIESLGVTGAILLSQAVRDQIKNHREFQLVSLGHFDFKNIDERMEVFALANDGLPVPGRKAMEEVGKLKPASSQKTSQVLKANWKSLTSALLFLVAVVFGALFFTKREPANSSQSKEWITSIAVLPFENLSNDPTQDYLSDGISNAIRSKLTGFKKLKVSPRSSSMIYKSHRLPLPQLGQELGVENILEGTIQRVGDDLKITVMLGDVKQDQLIWSPPTFNSKIDDILAFQEMIAGEVASQLNVELSGEEQKRLVKRYTNDPEVYELSLMAESTRDEKLWKQVIAMDSNYVPAYTALAFEEMVKGAYTGLAAPDSVLKISKSYLKKALEIDPEYGDAIAMSARYKFYFEWDFEGAEREFLKAIETSEFALVPYINLLFMTGRLEEANQKVQELESTGFLPHRWNYKGLVFSLMGRHEEAIRYQKMAIKRAPEEWSLYMDLGRLYVYANYPDSAILALEDGMKIAGIRPPIMLGFLGIAFFKTGQEARAYEMLNELENRWKRTGPSGSPAFCIGMVYAATGEKELAFEWLEKSFKAHEIEMIWLKIDPAFKSLAGDPRYESLLDWVGFPKEIKH
jgi:class 3 adenylate cyclase/TolB-like protein